MITEIAHDDGIKMMLLSLLSCRDGPSILKCDITVNSILIKAKQNGWASCPLFLSNAQQCRRRKWDGNHEMSYCIWMGWFSAFNQTLAQLLNVIVALINRDHGVISVSQWAPACCHAVHSHSLPTMDFNGFLASYSGPTCWERRARRSTLKQSVHESLLLTCKHIQIRTRNRIWNIQALHTVCVLLFSARYTPRCSAWIFRFLFSPSTEELWEHSWTCTFSQQPRTILGRVAFQEATEHILLCLAFFFFFPFFPALAFLFPHLDSLSSPQPLINHAQ